MSEERAEFVKKLTDRFDTKLNATTPVKNFPQEVRELLENLYAEKGLTPRLTATLLNGIFTEGRDTFLMSQPLMVALIKIDSKNGNLDRETLNDTEYKTFVKCLRDRDVIEVIEEPEQFSSDFPKGKAGTWKLCDRYPLKLFKSLLPQELDEDGYPLLDLSAEEMHEQWVNGGHAEHYYRWLEQQVKKEAQDLPASTNLKLVAEKNVPPELESEVKEIENRKNGPLKFY